MSTLILWMKPTDPEWDEWVDVLGVLFACILIEMIVFTKIILTPGVYVADVDDDSDMDEAEKSTEECWCMCLLKFLLEDDLLALGHFVDQVHLEGVLLNVSLAFSILACYLLFSSRFFMTNLVRSLSIFLLWSSL